MHAVDRSKPPKIHDFTLFKPGKPDTIVLANGIPYKQFHNSQLDLLHFIFKIKAGSFFEHKKSTAVFCYLLLKESSKTHTCSEVDEFFDYYGVNYTAKVSLEYVTINLIIPRHNCSQVLPYLFDFLAHPHFKEKNLEIMRKRKLMDLAYNLQKMSYCASQLMLHHFFGAYNSVGKILDENDLNSITIEDLYEYHQRTFCAENIRLFAAGNLNDEIHQTLVRLFETIPHGQPSVFPAIPVPASSNGSPILDRHQNCLQSSFFLCQRSIGYQDKQHHDFQILSTILGGYFGSRLMSNLRETNGYTYGISCDSLYFADTSIFYLESEVNVDVTRQAIEECFKEIERLGNEPVPADELRLVQNYMAGQLLRKVDNTVSYMTQYSLWDDFGRDEREFELQMRSITGFDSEKPMLLAQQFLKKNNFATIISGNIN
ncbi:MAG: insulinase family protein [Bacteroidales bacterium]|nr:insulinase family protein [Bacteroidales bacterium]